MKLPDLSSSYGFLYPITLHDLPPQITSDLPSFQYKDVENEKPIGRLPWRDIVYFHFTCLGTKKFLHFLPLLVVLDQNPKSSRSFRLQFFWEIHLYFDSFEAVYKLTRHFEY